jgi:hypothetical protein
VAESGSVLDIQDSLIEHVKTIEDPNNPGTYPDAGRVLPSCGFADGALPFFWVKRGRLISRQRVAAGVYEYVREYQLLLYVEEYCAPTETDDDTGQELAAEWFEPVLDSFSFQMKTLLGARYNVQSITDLGDINLRGIQNAEWFAGQVFLLQIKSTRNRH